MSYRQRKDVEASIKRREHVVKGKVYVGYEAYFGTDPFTKRPTRIMRDTEDELRKEIKAFYLRHQSGGEVAARLTALQALDAKNALDALASAGEHISLTEAVNAFLGGSVRVSGDLPDIAVGEAYKEFIKGKLTTETDKAMTNNTTGKWVTSYGADKRLKMVTAKEVADYLEKNYGHRKPGTYNSHLLYIKTFFNWCCKDERKYLTASPVKSLKYRDNPWEEPEYMKPEDVERLFRLLESVKDTHPEYLAQAVVSFFTGARAVEIRRMASVEDAAKINLEDETMRIAKGKGFQRGKRPRAFHIEATAMAWMTSFDFKSAIKRITKRTILDIYALARKNKIPVFQNCGRHTFITMDVAAYGKPEETQAKVGTSAKMRAENYCGLASKSEGVRYFQILPSKENDLFAAAEAAYAQV